MNVEERLQQIPEDVADSLRASQRAAIAVDLEPLFAKEAKERQGTRTDLVANLPLSSDAGKTRDKAADIMNVSPRSVQDAKRLKQENLKIGLDDRHKKKVVLQAG
jgi:hypothetical protein